MLSETALCLREWGKFWKNAYTQPALSEIMLIHSQHYRRDHTSTFNLNSTVIFGEKIKCSRGPKGAVLWKTGKNNLTKRCPFKAFTLRLEYLCNHACFFKPSIVYWICRPVVTIANIFSKIPVHCCENLEGLTWISAFKRKKTEWVYVICNLF